MVGDSRTDRDTARGADVPFVGVTFGYTPEPMATLAPDLLLDSFDAISRRTRPGSWRLRHRADGPPPPPRLDLGSPHL